MVGPAPKVTAPSQFQFFDNSRSDTPPIKGPFDKNPVSELPPVPLLQSRNGSKPSSPPSKQTGPQGLPAHGNTSGDKPDPAQWRVGLTRTFHDRSGGGTTDFRETVVAIRREGDLLIGRVKREELVPNKDTGEMEVIITQEVEVIFDTARGRIILKQGFNFQRADNSGTEGICAEPSPEKRVNPISDNGLPRSRATICAGQQQGCPISSRFALTAASRFRSRSRLMKARILPPNLSRSSIGVDGATPKPSARRISAGALPFTKAATMSLAPTTNIANGINRCVSSSRNSRMTSGCGPMPQ
jgi:hypothetical protein